MSSSYINQIDAAIGAVVPESGQNIAVTPNPAGGGLVVATTPSISVSGVAANTVTINGPNPAQTGSIRLGDSQFIAWRDVEGVADLYAGYSDNQFQVSNILTNGMLSTGPITYYGINQTANAPYAVTSVANAVGPTTTYTGTFGSGAGPVEPGGIVRISGFTNLANNGYFYVVSTSGPPITPTGVTVNNPSGVAETHPASLETYAVYQNSGTVATIIGLGQGSGNTTIGATTYRAVFGAIPNNGAVAFAMGRANDPLDMTLVDTFLTDQNNHGFQIISVTDGIGANPGVFKMGLLGGAPGFSCLLSDANTGITATGTGATSGTSVGTVTLSANTLSPAGVTSFSVTGDPSAVLATSAVATSPSNEFAAPSLVFEGSYWKNTPPGANPDKFSLDVTMVGSSMDNQSIANLTLNHTGAEVANFVMGAQIFRFMSSGENVFGTASSGTFQIETEQTNGAQLTLASVANAVGTTTTYTGDIVVIPPQAGAYITISGFANAANNGRFIVQGSVQGSSGTVTVYNSGGIAETHAAMLTFDSQPWYNGNMSSEGFGNNTGFKLLGVTHNVTMGSTAEPLAVPFVVTMSGNATDGGFLRIINNGATGNHGLEVGAVIDGTGAAPVLMHLGQFQGTPCVNIPTMPLIMGSDGTAATSSLEQPSPAVEFMGSYWTGSASAIDTWTLQDFLYLGYAYGLTSAADFGGGRAIYAASSTTFPLPPIGSTVRITGFTNLSNNGTFTVVDNRTGQFIVNNGSAITETHAGTATVTALASTVSTLILAQSGAPNAQVLLPTNSGSIPQLAFIGDPSCGLKYIGASQLEIVAGGETFGFSSQGGLFVGAASLSFLSQAGTISGTFDPANTYVLSAAANAVGADTSYTGSFSPVIPTGALVSISGFVNSGNNVTFAVTVSCSSTTLVLVNSNGVAESHAAVAETSNPCVYMGGGGATPNNFTASLGLPNHGYDPPSAGTFTSTQAGRTWFNNATNVVRYWDGTETVQVQGIPAKVNLTAQQVNSGPTTALAVSSSAAGLYEITVYIIVSQAASVSSTLPDTQIVYTDQDSGVSITVAATASSAGNTLTTFATASVVVNAAASTNIQYAIGQVTPYASSGGTPMQFAYRARVKRI